jgi:hypothetical protein
LVRVKTNDGAVCPDTICPKLAVVPVTVTSLVLVALRATVAGIWTRPIRPRASTVAPETTSTAAKRYSRAVPFVASQAGVNVTEKVHVWPAPSVAPQACPAGTVVGARLTTKSDETLGVPYVLSSKTLVELMLNVVELLLCSVKYSVSPAGAVGSVYVKSEEPLPVRAVM